MKVDNEKTLARNHAVGRGAATLRRAEAEHRPGVRRREVEGERCSLAVALRFALAFGCGVAAGCSRPQAEVPFGIQCRFTDRDSIMLGMLQCRFENAAPTVRTQCGDVVMACPAREMHSGPFCLRNVPPHSTRVQDVIPDGLATEMFAAFANSPRRAFDACTLRWVVVPESAIPVRQPRGPQRPAAQSSPAPRPASPPPASAAPRPVTSPIAATGPAPMPAAVVPPVVIQRLHPDQAAASSFINNPGNPLSADLAFDGNPATAWNEGARGPGTGEWIEGEFTEPVRIRRIRLATGWDFVSPRNGDLFAQNSHLRRVRVTFDGRDAHDLDVAPDQRSLVVDGLDVTAHRVRLIALEVYPGTRWADLCVSEIEIEGEPDRGAAAVGGG